MLFCKFCAFLSELVRYSVDPLRLYFDRSNSARPVRLSFYYRRGFLTERLSVSRRDCASLDDRTADPDCKRYYPYQKSDVYLVISSSQSLAEEIDGRKGADKLSEYHGHRAAYYLWNPRCALWSVDLLLDAVVSAFGQLRPDFDNFLQHFDGHGARAHHAGLQPTEHRVDRLDLCFLLLGKILHERPHIEESDST
jgi:hypothetical protein